MKRCVISVGLCAILGVTAGCANAGPTIGTVRVFSAPEAEVYSAITNAFGQGNYNDMVLSTAVGNDFLAHGWHPTNGFVLFPGTGSSYYAYFYLLPTAIRTNQTKVLVQTLESDVIAGKEPGVHGGSAFHFRKAKPDPHEETNVLDAIAAHLRSSNVLHAN